MPRFRLYASYGFVGTTREFGVYEFASEEEAVEAAYEMACEYVDSSAEPLSDDSEE